MMAVSTAFLHLLLLCLPVSGADSKVSLSSDGGYGGIVVKVGREVPEEKCQDILQNLKKLFEESSLSLYDALDGDAYFKSVQVVVPNGWRETMCKTALKDPKGGTPYRVADIKVTTEHAVHGPSPFTRQSRGCGQPGDFISVPWTFLDDWNLTWRRFGDPSRLFAREWAKYRYGVFDETGFPGDPAYPNYYVSAAASGDVVLPTGTVNAPVEGLWVDGRGRPDCDPLRPGAVCHFRPFVRNDAVNCSLGFMHFLPNVRSFCDRRAVASAGVSLPPTKHNVLCGGRSADEVIRKHDDFANRYKIGRGDGDGRGRGGGSQGSSARSHRYPTLSVVREPDPQYVLVMETSTAMDAHGQWRWINRAAQKFIRYDLPSGARLAIVTFSNTSEVRHELTEVRGGATRARLADSVPDKYHLSPSRTQNLLAGVQKAVHSVLGNNVAGGHLVVVTRGLQESLSISDEQTISEYVKYYHIKVSTILVPDGVGSSPGSGPGSGPAGLYHHERVPLAFYDSVAQSSGGVSRIVHGSSSRSIRTYLDLMDAFSGLLRGEAGATEEAPVTVHRNVIQMSGYASTSGRFTVDASLGRDTTFGVYVDDEDDHLIKEVTFTDHRGQKFGPYTSMSSAYDVINLKVVNYPVGSEPPFDLDDHLDTTWQYTIRWHPGGSHVIGSVGGGGGAREDRSAVVVTSRPKRRARKSSSSASSSSVFSGFDVELWTSAATSDIVTPSHPLAVFASVMARSDPGGVASPVVDAVVEVEVTVTAENGSIADVRTIRLRDGGDGDPDVTAGDGVYSRYLTSYPAAGRYEFALVVRDNNRRAYWVLPSGVGEDEDRQRRAMVPTSTTINSSSSEEDGPSSSSSAPYMTSSLRCCGSRVFPRGAPPEARKRLTGEFVRTQTGPVIHILQAPKPNSPDRMPPSRVVDLALTRADPDDPSAGLLATWTAPGDDYSDGAVAGYKLVYSADTTDLLDSFAGNLKYQVLTEIRRPDSAGARTSFQFRTGGLPRDRHLYLALVPADEAGNEGKISNLARVFLDSSVHPYGAGEGGGGGAGGDGPSQKPISSGEGGDEAVMIGILCGTFAVIAALLWAGIWYLRRPRGRAAAAAAAAAAAGRGSKGVNATLVSNHHNTSGGSNGGGDHDTSSSDIDLKPSGSLVVPQFSSIASGGAVGTYPGHKSGGGADRGADDANDATPTYWSASQLLNEHEQRTHQQQQQQQQQQLYSTTTYHNALGPLPLDPIVEDPEDTYGISEMYNRHHLATRVQQGINATSTPVKYSNMTFPRHQGSRHSHSAVAAPSPSPQENGGLLVANGFGVYGGGGGGGGGDPLYGYAQSEPPNGVYGTLQRRPSGNRVPPAIPPKPSLSALLGLDDSSASGGNNSNSVVVSGGGGGGGGGASPLLADDDGVIGSRPRRAASSDDLTGASGLTVRNVSQV